MENKFNKWIAALLICTLLVGGVPLNVLAEDTIPVVVEAVPEPAPEPVPVSEPEPDPVSEPAPEPEAIQEASADENPQTEDDQSEEVEENLPVDSDSVENGETEIGELPSDTQNENNSPEDDDLTPSEGADNDQEVNDAVVPPVADEELPPESADSEENSEDAAEVTIVSFDTTAFFAEKNVAYGTAEAELGLPSVLKATWSDGSSSEVSVSWLCLDDGNGGSAYIPEHTNPAAVYTFRAVLANGEKCSAELPVIYIAYEAIAEPLLLEPLVWEDVIVEIEEVEFTVDYKSVVFNVKKGYDLGLSVLDEELEEELEEPDLEIKPVVDDAEEEYNLIAFQNLESDTEYTVWAKSSDEELWSAFERTIKTEPVTIELTKQEEPVGADAVLSIGDVLSVETNLESPACKWYRGDQTEPVSEGASYSLTYDDVGAGLRVAVSEGAYGLESAELKMLPPAPAEIKLNTATEKLSVLFAEDIPAGASLVLSDSESAVIATLEVGEAGKEFSFEENMRAYAGKQLNVCLKYNEVNSAAKEITLAAIPAAPEKPEAEKVIFAAASQRSIDFSYTDLTGLEFAYKATDSVDAPTVISENPAVISDLSANTSYTLYFRSAATEVDFASEWAEAGFAATTAQLELSISPEDTVYFDSTITVSPKGNYLFAEGHPIYQWYCSMDAEFNEKAEVLEGVSGAELNLQEEGFTKADIGKTIFVCFADGYGNTSAVQSVQLRRYENPLLSLDKDERIVVGETVTATYNGTETDYVWQWYRGETAIEGANEPSYVPTAQDANCVLTVKVLANEAELASTYVVVDMYEPTAEVDYEKETITVSVSGAMPEGWTLRACNENGTFIDKAWPKDADSVTYSLAELGIDPDRHEAFAPDYEVMLDLLNSSGEGTQLHLVLPVRRDYSGTQMDMNNVGRPGAAELSFTVPDGLNLALSAEGGAAPDFSLGSGPSFVLQEKTRYQVWLRDAAVAGTSFAGKWAPMYTVETSTLKELSVSLKNSKITWKPKLEIPALSFSESGLSKSDLTRKWYDENGKTLFNEPSNVGVYTLKISLRSEAAKWYKLKNSEIKLTIEPMTMSSKNTRVTCEQLAYNGKEQLPQKMKIIVDGLEVDASEFAVEKVSGYDCIKAGSHIIRIAGKGNVTGGIKILFAISKAKPKSIIWPTVGYLVTGQKLSESRLTGGSTSAGTFAWENADTVPPTGSSKHNVVFTPTDTENYDWTGVTMVKALEVKVYSVSSSGGSSGGSNYNYNYNYSSSSSNSENKEQEDSAAANISGQVAAAFLSAGSGSSETDVLEIVHDITGLSMDYELLIIMRENTELDGTIIPDHTFMVMAQPDVDGVVVARRLNMSLAQLEYLFNEQDFVNLLFRNGGAEIRLRSEDVLTGNVAKLVAYMLNPEAEAEAEEIDLTTLDFDAMEEPVLERSDLADISLNVRIDPVILLDENETETLKKEAWRVSLWLCTETKEVEISSLVPSLTIGLKADDLYGAAGDAAADVAEADEELIVGNGMVLVKETGEEVPLSSEMKQQPDLPPVDQPDKAELYSIIMPPDIEIEADIWTDYTPDMDLNFYRNNVLTTLYAGSGMYMLMDQTEGF